MEYDPRVKYQVEKSGKDQEEAGQQLTQIRAEIDRIKTETEKKRQQIKELKTKKRSVKNLIKRNEMLYPTTRSGVGRSSTALRRSPRRPSSSPSSCSPPRTLRKMRYRSYMLTRRADSAADQRRPEADTDRIQEALLSSRRHRHAAEAENAQDVSEDTRSADPGTAAAIDACVILILPDCYYFAKLDPLSQC